MKSTKHFSLFRNADVLVRNLRRKGVWEISTRLRACVLALACAALAGCGTVAGLQLGSISVTDPSGAIQGQLTSVVINAKAAISVAVSSDPENLGVSWMATCGGSPISPPAANPCGTIAPVYVGNSISMTYTAPLYVPVGNKVTITATATSDPSISASTTIAIAPLPITIAIAPPPPAALGVNGTALIGATVTNDTLAAGVNWSASCGAGSASCGSFQSGLPIPTQTASTGQIAYTAPAAIPAGGTVTIAATSVTDPTKSANATVLIAPISVSVTTPTVTVPLGTTANLTALVAYDSANRGVDWGAPTCGSPNACGFLSQTHTSSGVATVYTPPSSIPSGATVTVVAKSTANPSATATVTITVAPPPPIVVAVLPISASAQVNGTAQLTATLTNDLAGLGADWTVSCGSAGACGSVTAHTASGTAATYTAPGLVPTGNTVTVTATSTSDKTKSAFATVAIVPAISIAFSPAPPASVTAGTPANFTATVSGDLAAAGVDWTVSCSSAPCGTFSSGNAGAPNHSASGASIAYTAPIAMPAVTVTIAATSTASDTALPVKSVSASVTVVPVIAVNFVPFAPTQMQVSNQLNGLVTSSPVSLTAAVTNDPTNAGVDWSVCSSASVCGQFQTVPAVAATSTAPAVNAKYNQTVHTASGQAAFYIPPPQSPSPGGTVTIAAQAHNPAATSSLATATATVAIVAMPTGVALQGVVLAGTNPVVGASVSLYAAGTSGYSSTSSPVVLTGSNTSVTTGSVGQFTIPAGYACPSQGSQMYLVATGGNAGAGINPNLAMMTALGPCGGLSATAAITIDEVTTIGSVWALAPFMSDYGHVGSSSGNATTGLANAFASVNNLVNVTTGQALATTPAGNGVVPRAEINTLADILNSCTATSGGAVGDGSKCGALFYTANPSLIAANAPINTLQAALNIAQTPYYNTAPGQGSVFSLLPANGPFSPVLSTAPNDWTISLSFTGGGLGSHSAASAIAIDASGDVWIANERFSSVTELNNQGAALSPTGTGATQATAGGFQGAGMSLPIAVAIDPLGNAWTANNGSISELPAIVASTYTGTLGGASFTGGGLGSSVKGLAIDGAGNLWAATGGSAGNVAWFAGANATVNGVATAPGSALSPSGGYTRGISSPSGGIEVDGSGTVWVMNSGNDSAVELSSATGSYIQSDFGYKSTVPAPSGSVLNSGVGTAIAIDSSGNVFLSPGGQLVELLAGGSSANFGGLGAASTGIGNTYSTYLAVDGAEHFWLLITGGSNFCSSSSSVVELSGSGAQLNTNTTGCGYLGTGIGTSNDALAVDGSGNLWVLNSGAVTEFVGVAAPVVTPFSLGVQNKTLGKKP
jgi:hypothetical protein